MTRSWKSIELKLIDVRSATFYPFIYFDTAYTLPLLVDREPPMTLFTIR